MNRYVRMRRKTASNVGSESFEMSIDPVRDKLDEALKELAAFSDITYGISDYLRSVPDCEPFEPANFSAVEQLADRILAEAKELKGKMGFFAASIGCEI